MRPSVVLIGIVTLAGCQQTSEQFDLSCRVSTTWMQDGVPVSDPESPATFRYRFDLRNKVWCDEQCRDGVTPIREVTPAFIVMKNEDGQLWQVDRLNGRISLRTDDLGNRDRLSVEHGGPCEKVEFTPMPKRKF